MATIAMQRTLQHRRHASLVLKVWPHQFEEHAKHTWKAPSFLSCAAALVFLLALQVLRAHGMQPWLTSLSFKVGGDTQVSRLSYWRVHQPTDTPLVLAAQAGAHVS